MYEFKVLHLCLAIAGSVLKAASCEISCAVVGLVVGVFGALKILRLFIHRTYCTLNYQHYLILT